LRNGVPNKNTVACLESSILAPKKFGLTMPLCKRTADVLQNDVQHFPADYIKCVSQTTFCRTMCSTFLLTISNVWVKSTKLKCSGPRCSCQFCISSNEKIMSVVDRYCTFDFVTVRLLYVGSTGGST